MVTDDPFREQSRLAETYAQLPNYKLEEIARNPGQLTDDARNVLEVELHKRGIKVDRPGTVGKDSSVVSNSAGELQASQIQNDDNVIEIVDPDVDLSEWMAVSQSSNFEDVEYLYDLIKSAGIECILTLSHEVDHHQGVKKNPGSIKLCVRKIEVETVDKIFDFAYPPKLMMKSEELYLVVKCPGCGSREIKNQAMQVHAKPEGSLDVDQATYEPRWECLDCGYRWHV